MSKGAGLDLNDGEVVMSDIEREAFEQWFKSGRYVMAKVSTREAMFDAWQAARAQQGDQEPDPVCETCNGSGCIGGPTYYAPDEGGELCPDCSAPSPEQSKPTNRYGVDAPYFHGKLSLVLRDLENYTPDELARSLARLVVVADKNVLAEPEFTPEQGQAAPESGTTHDRNPNAARQYYFKNDNCRAKLASDPECICWYDEGTGPLRDFPENIKSWRPTPPAEGEA